MDMRDLILRLQTIQIRMMDLQQYLAEGNQDMAFVTLVEVQNKAEMLKIEINQEIENQDVPVDLNAPGPCSCCPSNEAYWCIDPYMKDVFNETYYLFLCYKCYQDKLDDI